MNNSDDNSIELKFIEIISKIFKPLGILKDEKITQLEYYLYKLNSVYRLSIEYYNTPEGKKDIRIFTMKKDNYYYLVEQTNFKLGQKLKYYEKKICNFKEK